MLESEYMINVLTNIRFFLLMINTVSWAATVILTFIATVVWIDDEGSDIELKRMKKLLRVILPLTLVMTALLIFVPWNIK